MLTKTTFRWKLIKFLMLFLVLSIAYTANASTDTLTPKISPDGVPYVDYEGAKFLPLEQARAYVKKYRNRRQTRVNRFAFLFGGHKDAYNIFFDIRKIDSIIAQAKRVIAKRPGSAFCGLRFYYAKYPRNHPYTPDTIFSCLPPAPGPYNYGLRHTLVVVPQEYVDGMIRDITIENKFTNEKFVMVYGVMAENQGTLCPPQPPSHCNGTILSPARR